MYLLAILCPPLAVAIAGKPFQALINFIFSIFIIVVELAMPMMLLPIFLFFGALLVVHAFMVVSEYKADKRMEKMSKFSSNKEGIIPKKESYKRNNHVIY